MSAEPIAVIVEDRHRARRYLEQELQDFGFDVESFNEASSALEWLQTRSNAGVRPAVLVVDVMLPFAPDGLDLGKTLRRGTGFSALADVPILFISAMPGDHVKQECLSLGPSGFLARPFLRPGLEAALIGLGVLTSRT